MRRRRTRLAAATVVAALVALAGSATALAADRLPDLGMAQPSELRITKQDGRKLLRYTAVVANVGAGPLELRGSREGTTGDMTVVQHVYGTSEYDVATLASMHFAGDGHSHWHVRDLETGVLTRLDNGVKVGTLAKHGFCFYDTTAYRLSLPGAPSSPVYGGCGSNPLAKAVTMGLSVGWSDVYPWSIAYQYIDVTGLTPGRYRLTVGASTALGLQEVSTSNNTAWVEIQLKSNSVRVVGGSGSI